MVALMVAAAAVHAEVIERVMAVVDGALILQSDVRAASRFGLLPSADTLTAQALLDRLIARRLVLTEVNRYAPPEPDKALIDRRMEDVRARFPSAEVFDAALAESGITLDQLALHVRDNLRIDAYLQQRFSGAAQPTEAEVLQYYRDNQEMFTRGGIMRPFGEVHDEARAALVQANRTTVIREWVTGLRSRANVTVPGIVDVR